MEPDNITSSPLAYLKSHPFIPVSLVLSLVALGFGAVSLLHTPTTSFKSNNFQEVDSNTTSTLPTTNIAVDIEGQVSNPGMLLLENDPDKQLRIADVITKAGGLLPAADQEYIQKNMNLAALVSDGMKLYIPKKGEMNANMVLGATTAGEQKINVNTASASDLEKLSGVGSTRAEAIITNRPYSTIEELKDKAKLPGSIIDKIKDRISF